MALGLTGLLLNSHTTWVYGEIDNTHPLYTGNKGYENIGSFSPLEFPRTGLVRRVVYFVSTVDCQHLRDSQDWSPQVTPLQGLQKYVDAVKYSILTESYW